MSWFNTYESDGDGLTRKVVTEVDLRETPLTEWTDNELGFRLAVIYPLVDGYGHLNADEVVEDEVVRLMDEIEKRGYVPYSNLQFNERCSGWGWLPGFVRRGNS